MPSSTKLLVAKMPKRTMILLTVACTRLCVTRRPTYAHGQLVQQAVVALPRQHERQHRRVKLRRLLVQVVVVVRRPLDLGRQLGHGLLTVLRRHLRMD